MKKGLLCTAIILVLLLVSYSDSSTQEKEPDPMKSAADNTYMSLGRAYRMIGDHEQDRKSVEKAFALQNRGLLAGFMKKNKETLARTADEFLERHLEAIGGRQNLEKIKTMVITYSGFDSIDQDSLITRYYKFPHFIRQDNADTGCRIRANTRRHPQGYQDQRSP